MRPLFAVFSAMFLFAVGCNQSKKVETKQAVQTAIESHLSQRPNMMLSSMTLEVDDVKFSGDTAEAEAKFHSKQSPTLAVGVHYKLRRTGEKWQVESSTPSGGMGGSPHGSSAPTAPAPSSGEVPLQSSH